MKEQLFRDIVVAGKSRDVPLMPSGAAKVFFEGRKGEGGKVGAKL